ncbi:hypothetical protein DFH06DRAFT_1128988 [Mycena polygramma]|nr:hypothetical protein DFH06DRAFT_1128988 [Mycena polygramma]
MASGRFCQQSSGIEVYEKFGTKVILEVEAHKISGMSLFAMTEHMRNLRTRYVRTSNANIFLFFKSDPKRDSFAVEPRLICLNLTFSRGSDEFKKKTVQTRSNLNWTVNVGPVQRSGVWLNQTESPVQRSENFGLNWTEPDRGNTRLVPYTYGDCRGRAERSRYGHRIRTLVHAGPPPVGSLPVDCTHNSALATFRTMNRKTEKPYARRGDPTFSQLFDHCHTTTSQIAGGFSCDWEQWPCSDFFQVPGGIWTIYKLPKPIIPLAFHEGNDAHLLFEAGSEYYQYDGDSGYLWHYERKWFTSHTDFLANFLDPVKGQRQIIPQPEDLEAIEDAVQDEEDRAEAAEAARQRG